MKKIGRLIFDPKCTFVKLTTRKPRCSFSTRSVCTSGQNNINETAPNSQQLVSSTIDDSDNNHGNFSGSKTLKTGVVFDIDGVLLRGRKVIPCATEAIAKLEQSNIPLIYLTNGGCETEESKASVLEKRLGVQVMG